MAKKYESLKLENQLCFPLYAASKEVIRKYTPILSEYDLTYTQYITLMVLWEEKEINVKSLGERLFLDSGTITPVLKQLENKGYVSRSRSKKDERILIVSITKIGEDLKDKLAHVPEKIGGCINLSEDEAKQLYNILYKILGAKQDE